MHHIQKWLHDRLEQGIILYGIISKYVPILFVSFNEWTGVCIGGLWIFLFLCETFMCSARSRSFSMNLNWFWLCGGKLSYSFILIGYNSFFLHALSTQNSLGSIIDWMQCMLLLLLFDIFDPFVFILLFVLVCSPF